MPDDEPPSTHDVALHEFDYIAQCAIQNNEDRVRASQLYFLTFATLVAAVGGAVVSLVGLYWWLLARVG